METLIQDIRQAMRVLRRRPLFSLVAVMTLALGIGANTALFSVVNALLLRPPTGVGNPDRVVDVGRTRGAQGGGFDTFTYPDFLDLRAGVPHFEHLSAWRMVDYSVSTGEGSERATGLIVSADYFETMGVAPARGRFFLPEEDEGVGAHAVAVVSHHYWQDRLGGDPEVVGRTLQINRHPFTVVGVAAEGFRGHLAGFRADVFIPVMMVGVGMPGFRGLDDRRVHWMMMAGRLKPGATIAQADAAMAGVFGRLAELYPESHAERGARAVPLGPIPGGGRKPVAMFLSILMVLVGVVLLVTCANVAGMLLARAAAREKEIAVRLAIGAGRGRLMRQLVTEALVLFLVGGAAGVALAVWGTGALAAMPIPSPVPIELDFSPDARVLGFALAVSLLTGLVFGLAPALQATRPALVPALKDEGAGRGTRKQRMRRVFVGAQVGLSLLLLVTAGLFLRSLQSAAAIDTGFDAEGVATTALDLSLDGYDQDRGILFQTTLLERVRALPAVEAAGLAMDLPMDLNVNEMPVFPEGYEEPAGREGRGLPSVFNTVSPGYFHALGTAILQGRDFQAADRLGAPRVVIVDRTLADRVWPGESAIGKHIAFPERGPVGPGEPWTVVGVVAPVKHQMITEAPKPTVYRPMAQAYTSGAALVARMRRGDLDAAPAIRREIQALDPDLALTRVLSLEEYTGVGLLPQRIAATVTVAIAALALLLSALGVYGTVAFAVAQRTREIGIRMALGAEQARVVRMVVRSGLALALPGLAVGAVLALALGRLLRGFLLGVPPADPAAFALGAAVLLAAVVAACVVPARRAARVDPVTALRAQ